MAIITKGNWMFQDPGDNIPNGSTIEGGNFSQKEPDTEIMIGKTLTINGGNFVNVKPDPNWTITGGNWAKINRCAHLHTDWNINNGIDDCPTIENCSHVYKTDTITIDGETLIIYKRKDTRIGKSWPT